MKPLTPTQANVLKLWKSDVTVCDDSKRLTATYWMVYDKLLYGSHANVYEMLKSVTPDGSIQRARRFLNENGYIKYSKEADEVREKEYKEHTEQYSNSDIYAKMREQMRK